MEAPAGATGVRGATPANTAFLPPRKEWRAVSEPSVRNAASEESVHSDFRQSGDRTTYEIRQPADVDFSSITNGGASLDSDILKQRLHNVGRQREELQQIEIDLQAQIIARPEIKEVQKNYDVQVQELATRNVKLQEQLNEMEQTIHDLQRQMEEKERELQTIRRDSEAAWAKDDLLREQSKELQTLRRERDNFEAERAQHIEQICKLQEHIQDKDREFFELQEQQRIAQEAILYRDEQLREAQAWITHAQEMDAMHSTNIHSLQAELRERTDQYNQLWLGCQRQFAEMERIHLHTVQQLQVDLADARERSGGYPDFARISPKTSNDISQTRQNNGNQPDANGSFSISTHYGVFSNGNVDSAPSLVSAGNSSSQVHGIQIAPSSLVGMPAYLPPGQLTALHPFTIHQHGVADPAPSQVTQENVSHFHSVSAITPQQHWNNQHVQAISGVLEMPTHSEFLPQNVDQNLLRSDANYEYEVPGKEQAIPANDVSQVAGHNVLISGSAEEKQVLEQVDDRTYLVVPHAPQSLTQISMQFQDALRLDPHQKTLEAKENAMTSSTNHEHEGHGSTIKHGSAPSRSTTTESHIIKVNHGETAAITNGVVSSEPGQNIQTGGKALEMVLLDERSLLACIVRTIPPGSGGRIRISSSLPNRLSKMLAPLHWHDYKKTYGKLDDFVAGHPELFIIEGDYIQLRDGAQEIIAATAAVAKVAAAAKTAPSPFSSLLPSVAVTPIAQSQRLKRAPPNNSSSLGTDRISGIKILSKPRQPLEQNGFEGNPGQSAGAAPVGSVLNHDRSSLDNPSRKDSSAHERRSANFVGKLQGRR